MNKDHRAFGCTLGPCRADELLRQCLAQSTPRQSCDVGTVNDAQRHGGQHPVRGVIPTRHIKPSQFHPKDHRDQRPEHEAGHAQSQRGQNHAGAILDRARFQRRDGTQRNTDAESDQQRRKPNGSRHRKALSDDLIHPTPRHFQRRREMEGGIALHLSPELHIPRLIQSVISFQHFTHMRLHLPLLVERPARTQLQQQKGNHDHREDDHDSLEDSADDEAQHFLRRGNQIESLVTAVFQKRRLPALHRRVQHVRVNIPINRQNGQLI